MPSEMENPRRAQYAAQQNIPCKLERTLPFVPNAALLFLNGPHSWHGQELNESFDRKNYNCNFTIRNDLRASVFRPIDAARFEP